MNNTLYSKLWDKGIVNIPPLTSHTTCCGVGVLGKFKSSDGVFLAKVGGSAATKEEMDEYWEFTAALAMGTGFKMFNFTDRVGPREYNDVCGQNFYEFLSRRQRRLGKVIASPERQALGKPNHVRLYIWLPKMVIPSWVQGTYTYSTQYWSLVTGLVGRKSADAHVSTAEYGKVREMFDWYPRKPKDTTIYTGNAPTTGVDFDAPMHT